MLFDPRERRLTHQMDRVKRICELIAYASSEGSGEPAHPRSLTRTFAARSYKQWIKRNCQTENQIPGPSEWLDMRSWNLSWRNARRHKFAWRGSNHQTSNHIDQDSILRWNKMSSQQQDHHRNAGATQTQQLNSGGLDQRHVIKPPPT